MLKEKNWIERRERNYLKDVLPIETPFSMQVETIRACNFKCTYCAYSIDDHFKIKKQLLTFDLFKKFTNDMNEFPCKLKTLTFSGLGEPLLDNRLPAFISLAKSFAEKVVVISNGSLLTEELSQKLVDSGLDTIRLSLQGLDSDDYYKTCGVKIDYDKFISNIKYLYMNKKQCDVYVKMPDICIDTSEKQRKFHKIYEDICDGMSIQAISPIQNEVKYSKIKKDFTNTIYNDQITQEVMVCPQPFYSMQLMADGTVRPCCSIELSGLIIGDVSTDKMVNIWNGEKLKKLRLAHLNNQKNSIPVCKKCNYPKFLNNKYDNIDAAALLLVEKYA